MKTSRGKVLTVCGDKSPESLGITLTHEHVFVDFRKGLVQPSCSNSQLVLSDLSLKMENLGVIRRFPYSVGENLTMNQVEEAISELKRFKQSGGSTLCELSVVGMRCNPYEPRSLVKVSEETDVNIVHATGFYCEKFIPDWAKMLSVKDMVDHMSCEINGLEGGVPHGVVYIGCSSPLGPTEKKSLEAAAIIQREIGPGIILHPGRSKQSAGELLDMLDLYGVDLSHVCLSHIDRTFTSSAEDRKALLELAARGCYLNYSLFGKDCSHYQYDLSFDMPSDAQRISQLKFLIDAGFEKQLLLSHDVVCKHELTAYGGTGYCHLLDHIVSKMEQRGISRQVIDTLLISNTSNLLMLK